MTIASNSEVNTLIKAGEGELYISSDYLISLLNFGIELGLKQGELLKSSGLGVDILIRPGISIGHQSFIVVVSNFIALKPDMALAVDFGKRMTLSQHGALGIAARYSRTTEDAATAVVSFMRTRAEIFNIRRERNDKNRRLYVDFEVEPCQEVYFIALAFLTSIEFIIRQMISAPKIINSQISLPLSCDYWRGKNIEEGMIALDDDVPGATIQFNAPTLQLSWPVAALDDSLPSFDLDLVVMAQGACEEQLQTISVPTTIKLIVESELRKIEGSLPTVAKVAQTLNMSSATLKRKLKAEHTSFREIRDEALYKRSKRILQESQLPIELIADSLGYSDGSNFSKAFKNWSGMTPSEYRQQ